MQKHFPKHWVAHSQKLPTNLSGGSLVEGGVLLTIEILLLNQKPKMFWGLLYRLADDVEGTDAGTMKMC